MPNYCAYSMNITGKPENVDELVKIIQNDYDGTPNEPLHLWRVFSADFDGGEDYGGGLVSVRLFGDCAWSVYTCMTEGGYQADHNNENRNGTTLENETRRLQLVVEVFSEEPGIGFMEHYIIANGEIIIEKCVDWNEYFVDQFESVEEFNNQTGFDWSEEQFREAHDACDTVEIGGFEWDFENGETLYKKYIGVSEINTVTSKRTLPLLNRDEADAVKGCKKINTLKSIFGSIGKQNYINENSNDIWFTKFLYYALNPMITYNISEKTLKKAFKGNLVDHDNKKPFQNIFECCEYLSGLNGVDNATINRVAVYLQLYCNNEEKELYTKLISKTLKLGVTAKTVNKIIPGLIPEWEVQRAYPIEKYPINEDEEFWLTQKLNGVRATFYRGKLIARSGVAFKGLEHIIDEINNSSLAGYVLDGELTLKDNDEVSDNEAFRIATGILNSDDMNKTAICYTVFDVITYEDFECDTPRMKYSERRAILDGVINQHSNGYLRMLPVLYYGSEQSKIEELLEQMVREDKEGLMLNTDVPYKRTRHKGILKIKKFYTMDLPIIRCEEGSGRLEGTLGAIVVDYKGNEVKVGSGFTDEQIPNTRLMRRTPVVIRIDGKAFHTFTRGFKRPFDDILIKTMQDTTKYLCEHIQGCVLGYTQSDEISLILTDYKTLNTDAWFNYEIQKICSISASMATMAFNKFFNDNISEWCDQNNLHCIDYFNDEQPPELLKLHHTYWDAFHKGAMFDARCFNIPVEEVTNYIYWRQLDATRNSIQMVGQAFFSPAQLHGKSCSNIQDMLMEHKNINWNNFPIYKKRGTCVIKQIKDVSNGEGLHRTEWIIDSDIPIFKGENRAYIDKLITERE